MAYRYTRRTTRPPAFWAQLLAAGVVLFPLSLNQIDYRAVFSRGVSVAAEKSSPAYAAFEDSKAVFASEFEIPDRGQNLASGETFDYRIARTQIMQRQIALRGLTVTRPIEEAPAQMVAAQHPVRVPSVPVPESAYHVDPQDDAWSIGAVAQKLVEREVRSQRRVIRTASGGTIVVARAGVDVDDVAAPRLAANEDHGDEALITSLARVTPSLDLTQPLTLNGDIELTGGLAMVGAETQIVVRRVLNGANFEKGQIWVTDAKFQIQVKNPVGHLVAELFTRDGRVLGRGELDLFHLRDVEARERRIDDLRLVIWPTTDSASMRTIAAAGPTEPVREARVEIEDYRKPSPVNEDGVMSEPTLGRESSFVARATANKHWSSLVVGQGARPQDVRLFSNSLVEALIELNLKGTDRAEAFHQSVIWGQIRRAGAPVEGARAEMAGDYQAIYFNEAFLPDPQLSATGKNGLFAFLRVKSGVQAVRVRIKGRLYPAQIFPTEEKHVSYVDLELRDKVVSQFKVFDVLDLAKPVQARMRLVGTDEMLNLTNDEFVEYSVAANTFMVEAEGGAEYETSRTTLSGTPYLVQVPLVRRDWLRQLALDGEVAVDPRLGVIAGFVDQRAFRVEMTGARGVRIVYFDAGGKPTPGNVGVPGGGFAIFNAPPGLQTVFIHTENAKDTFSQVVVAEPAYVHVMTWSP